jgi:maltooligosyltrehalose trehalohydrolase
VIDLEALFSDTEMTTPTAAHWRLRQGASVIDDGVEFRVWAPRPESVEVRSGGETVAMERGDGGEWFAFWDGMRAGAEYSFVLNGDRVLPDPVSRSQPHGVHGPSRVVDPAFRWTDAAWKGLPLADHVIYELHVGTFTTTGDFDGVVAKLPYLRDLGVTAIELMPVAEFPGVRNWGYDGVCLYAPHSGYGGPLGLKELVDAAHVHGIAVLLDVVYNHLGPEGNYLREFGPFFTQTHRTPWGDAVNFEDRGSDGVRRFFLDNALYWISEYHIDGLRLDAIHSIYDQSATHFLEELADAVRNLGAASGRLVHTIAESDLDDVRVIRPREQGGWGLDAQWHDDFHHALFARLTGDRRGFLVDFGHLNDVKKSIDTGFVFDGRYSVYRDRRFGSSSTDRPGEQFVAFLQNHDQVANTSHGQRTGELLNQQQLKLGAALLLLSPCVPMLFMGEEYGETAPFYYFTSHGDPALAEAVRQGRTEEYSAYFLDRPIPDPQYEATFELSKLDWASLKEEPHASLLAFHRALLRLRRDVPALQGCRKDLTQVSVDEQAGWLMMERRAEASRALIVANLSSQRCKIELPDGDWRLALSNRELEQPATCLEPWDLQIFLEV